MLKEIISWNPTPFLPFFFPFPGVRLVNLVGDRCITVPFFFLSIYSIVRKYGLINIRKLQSMSHLVSCYITVLEFKEVWYWVSRFSFWVLNVFKIEPFFILYSYGKKAVKSRKVHVYEGLRFGLSLITKEFTIYSPVLQYSRHNCFLWKIHQITWLAGCSLNIGKIFKKCC